MKLKNILLTFLFLGSTESFSANYKKLNNMSDSLADRINNHLPVTLEMIQDSLGFLSEEDEKEIQKHTTIPQKLSIHSQQYDNCYEKYEEIYALFEGVKIVQAEVSMLLSSMNTHLKNNPLFAFSQEEHSTRVSEDLKPLISYIKTAASSSNSSRISLQEKIPDQSVFDQMTTEELDCIIERAKQSKESKKKSN